MTDTWNGETQGLGAGSYPGAPDLPDYDHEPRCAECGWGQDLKEINGILLCRDCREVYYLKNCRDLYWKFISESYSGSTKRDFALVWWFDNLPEETQGEILFRAFQREFESCLPQVLNLREEEISGYVKDHAGDFLDYIEERDGI